MLFNHNGWPNIALDEMNHLASSIGEDALDVFITGLTALDDIEEDQSLLFEEVETVYCVGIMDILPSNHVMT